MRAALALIEERGPKGFTLREAARLAGVSHAAPYRHFADREALLAAIAEEGFLRMRQEMLASMETAGEDPGQRFYAQGAAYVRFAVAHPGYFRVMFGAEVRDHAAYPSLAQASSSAFALLVGGVSELQCSGMMPGRDPRLGALSPWALVHGLASLIIDGQLVMNGMDAIPLEELIAITLAPTEPSLAEPRRAR